MNISAVKAWFGSATNINGIGLAVGVIAGTVAHMITHETDTALGIGASAAAMVHLVLPENTQATSSVQKLVTDVVKATAEKKLALALPMLIQDGIAVVNSLVPPTPAQPITTTVVTVPASVVTTTETQSITPTV